MVETTKKRSLVLWISLLILAAILLNLILLLIPARARFWDVSANKLYTLSAETKEYLSELDEPVTLYLLNSDGSDAQFEYYLEHFCTYSNRLDFRIADAEDCETLLARAGTSSENIASNTLILDGERRTAVLQYSDLFYYTTDNQSLNEMGFGEMTPSQYEYYVAMFSQSEQYTDYLALLLNEVQLYFGGEAALLTMLEYVRAEIIPTHYVLTGHGESDLSSTLYAQISLSFGGGYRVLDFASASSVPADAASVLLFAPTEDYSTEKIEALRTYVEGGGLLTVVTGTQQLSFPNLSSFLGEYGLSATSDVVMEEIRVLDEEEIEEPTVMISDSVDVIVHTEHGAMATLDLEGVAPMITKGNAISFRETEKPFDRQAILTTSSGAMLGEDPATKGKKVLAAAVEAVEGGKLVWFTGAESFAVSSEEMSDDSAVYNAYCLYLVRDWTNLTYESTVTLPDEVCYDASYLQMTGEGTLFLMIVSVVLIPISILAVGFVICRRRKKV